MSKAAAQQSEKENSNPGTIAEPDENDREEIYEAVLGMHQEAIIAQVFRNYQADRGQSLSENAAARNQKLGCPVPQETFDQFSRDVRAFGQSAAGIVKVWNALDKAERAANKKLKLEKFMQCKEELSAFLLKPQPENVPGLVKMLQQFRDNNQEKYRLFFSYDNAPRVYLNNEKHLVQSFSFAGQEYSVKMLQTPGGKIIISVDVGSETLAMGLSNELRYIYSKPANMAPPASLINKTKLAAALALGVTVAITTAALIQECQSDQMTTESPDGK